LTENLGIIRTLPGENQMKSKRIRGSLALAVVALVAIWIGQSGDDAPPTTPGQNPDIQQTPGMVGHIDPETGEFVQTAPADQGSEPGTGRATDDLGVEPAPGGGEMVIVGDRFHQSATAVADSDGVTIECVPKEHAPDGSDASEDQGGGE